MARTPYRMRQTFVALMLLAACLAVSRLSHAVTTAQLRGSGAGTDQGRVNNDPETGLKVRTPDNWDFSGADWPTGSASSGDAFGDAGDARLVLEFDIRSIPEHQTILSASLQVFLPTDLPAGQRFLVRFDNGLIDINCHHLQATNDGSVTLGDYAGASMDLGVIVPRGVDPFASDPTAYTLDVSEAVAADYASGESHSSFRLQSAPTFTDKSDHYVGIVTQAYANPDFRPFLSVTYGASAEPTYSPNIADIVGANGFPGNVGFFSHDTTDLWKEMGLRFFRHEVLWGEVEQTQDSFDFSPTTPDALNHDLILSTAAAEGFEVVVILAYTAPFASTGPPAGSAFRQKYQSYFPPADPADWLDYVERTVSRYTGSPYNVRYFEVWNEPFAEFWRGTREQYIDTILIPAAQAIHNLGAKVVAPAWSGAGTSVLEDWISYNGAWNHIDILSTHYGWGDRDTLYKNWIANGRIEGLWHTEVSGHAEKNNPLFVAQSYSDALDWYLRRKWNSPDKYKYLYWTDGVTESNGEFLINQTRSSVFLTDQGLAMRTFTSVFAGEIRLFGGTVIAPGTSAYAFETDAEVLLSLGGVSSGGQIVLDGFHEALFPVARALAIDVVDGAESNLSFIQATDQVSIELPAGDSHRYVVLQRSMHHCYRASALSEVCQDDLSASCDVHADCSTGICLPRFVTLQGVSLVDTFGAASAEVKKPRNLCDPIPLQSSAPHYQRYPVNTGPNRIKGTRVLARDLFGDHVIELAERDSLYVPAAKDPNRPVGPPPPGDNHYLCYKAKNKRRVCTGDLQSRCRNDADCAQAGGICDLGFVKTSRLTDQLGAGTVEVKRPRLFCTPVDKNGEGIPNPDNHLVGYQVKGPGTNQTVHTHDPFGPGAQALQRNEFLMLPAEKHPSPP